MIVPWPAAAVAVSREEKVVLAPLPTATAHPTPATAGLPAPSLPPTATTMTIAGIHGRLGAPAAAPAVAVVAVVAPAGQGAGGAAGFRFLMSGRVPQGLVVVVVAVVTASVMTRGEPSRGGTRSARCSMRTRRSGGWWFHLESSQLDLALPLVFSCSGYSSALDVPTC